MVFNRIIKPTLVIMLTACISGFILVNVNNITSSAIKLNSAKKEKIAIGVVLPGFTVSDERTGEADGGESFRYWVGEKTNPDNADEVVKGYAFVTSSPGYSGAIDSMVGIDQNGKILGIYIINQKETPGLGARCLEVVSPYTIWDLPEILSGTHASSNEEEPLPWFQNQFEGLDTRKDIKIMKIGDWTQEKRQQLLDNNAITSITGATITGRAIINSIKKGCISLEKNLAETEAN